MKLTKLALAMASVIGAGLATEALALDLYVDTKTQQIFAEPGKGRVKLGSFEKVGEASAQQGNAELKAEIEQIKEDLALKNNELKALDEHMKVAEEVKVKMGKKGVEFESADKDFKFRMGGRIHADASYSSGDDNLVSGANHAEASDGTEIRRARIEMVGTFWKDWDFKSQWDFGDNKVTTKDMYIQYSGIKDFHITAGQQKQLFSRELYESSNDLMFMERSLMNSLAEATVDRAIGLSVATAHKDWTGAVGIYGETVTPTTDTSVDEGWGISSRWTFAPLNEKTHVVHLGISGNYRDPNQGNQVPEGGSKQAALTLASETSHMSNLKLINTGGIANVAAIKMVGLEANYLNGPFTVGGEYSKMWVDRKTASAGDSNLDFSAWYAEASYTLTGESRKYKKGKFYKLSPKQKFSLKNGTWGAWELAGRYSEADLNSADITGGQMSLLTVALNWYINDNVRFMADYNKTLDLSNSPITTVGGGDPNVDTFMLRGQLAF
ncbi:OprO/OprP family phosphate-selective porin [Methylomonas methanica]|uniref:Phosphate-selective porin O and P n=1 Tax=Methylomonas methanica (strain DSM 25384 / MC09) TaxID=857087 RepID=G0A360_METMM|nr:porin [Methylomonas methanica]AEF98992.1 phosphate-selective porin O and P [Methylomonas methanica MC09]